MSITSHDVTWASVFAVPSAFFFALSVFLALLGWGQVTNPQAVALSGAAKQYFPLFLGLGSAFLAAGLIVERLSKKKKN